jgi:heme-degrading monooxygenase HmoA
MLREFDVKRTFCGDGGSTQMGCVPSTRLNITSAVMSGFAMLGFISLRHYMSDDDEMLTVIEFASAQALATWRDHPDHRKVQQRGRNEFYAEYEIINCAMMHKYGYKPQRVMQLARAIAGFSGFRTRRST